MGSNQSFDPLVFNNLNMKLMYSIIIVLVAVALVYFALNKAENKPVPQSQSTMNSSVAPENTVGATNVETKPSTPLLSNELLMTTTKEGTGPESKNGDTLSVNYTGYLADGTKFDSSFDRGTPFEFTLGTGQVIKGWEIGMLGMKKGEVRKLIIPSRYGYGEAGFPGVIPGNATLAFEVELIEIK